MIHKLCHLLLPLLITLGCHSNHGLSVNNARAMRAELCSGTIIHPDWDLHELYIDVVGFLRWKEWNNIGKNRRDSVLAGLPITTSFGSPLKRYSFNEEVKVLAWSAHHYDMSGIDSIYAGPQWIPQILVWVHYAIDQERTSHRWALLDMWRGTRLDSATLGARWRAGWLMRCREMTGDAHDSIRNFAVRTFDHPPSNADIYRFIDDRACTNPDSPGSRRDFFTVDNGSAPNMYLLKLDTAICADAWVDVIGEKPIRHFEVK